MKSEDKLLIGLPDSAPAKLRIYANNNIAIMKPDHFIVNSECCFEHYHFSVPVVTTPPTNIGKKQYIIKANRFMVLNPEESIVVTQDVPTKEYTSLFINKKFLQEIAYTVTGKSDVQFQNDGGMVSKRLRDSFENFEYEFSAANSASSIMLDSIGTQIAIQMLREIKSNISDKIQERTYSDKSYAKKAIDFIHEYYNSDISLNDLCKVTHLSPYHFIRIFKAETGQTPHEYIMDIKMQNAMDLIKSGQYSLSEVAQVCGFVNQSHFSTAFKKQMGINPSTYKKRL